MLDFRVPQGAECIAEFGRWIGESSKHGLIWLIDGLDRIDCEQFEWIVSTLRATERGVILIITCSPTSLVSYLSESPDIENVQQVSLGQLSPSRAYDLQALYLPSYQVKTVDEAIINQLCDASSSVLHLRVNLAAYRLLPPESLKMILNCASAQDSFTYLFVELSSIKPALYFSLLLIGLCNCGVRESELLYLLGCSSKDLWEARDLLLDEWMVLLPVN